MSVKQTIQKKNTIKFIFLIAIWTLVVFALACWAVFLYAGTGSLGAPSPAVPISTNTQPEPPIKAEQKIVTMNLAGKWTTKVNETVFNVEISNSTVTIKLTKNGSSMLYWYGTFSETATVGENITSNKLDINKAVLSGASSKMFVVKQNSLAFDVSAMGQTKNVEVTHA